MDYTHYTYDFIASVDLETDSDYGSLPELIPLDDEYNPDDFVNESIKEKKFAIESVIETLQNDTEQLEECGICFDNCNKTEFITFECDHEFCNDCVKRLLYSDSRPKPCCAYCRKEINKIICRTNIVYDKISDVII